MSPEGRPATDAGYTIRRATEADVADLVALRVALFRETGGAEEDDPMADFEEATFAYLASVVPSGELIAFVAEAPDGTLVATSGLIFFQRAPTQRNLTGRDAYILNMYTVPAWRGRGIAHALVERLLGYLRTETNVPHVFLHAQRKARPIYERAGFRAMEDLMALWLDE